MGITEIIKRNGDIISLNSKEPFVAIKTATLNSSLMGDDYISLQIISSGILSFAKGDKIVHEGKEYTIRATTTRQMESEDYYIYEPVFYGVMYDLMKTLYRNCDVNGKSDRSTFDLTYTIKEFARVIVNNLNRDYPNLWTFDEASCPDTEPRTIQFSSVNCLQALQTLCNKEQFNLEFQITQNCGVRTIHIGKFGQVIIPPTGADSFEWGKGGGLYKLKEQKIDDKAIITRLWVEGGTANLRSEYRNYSERLQLPYPQRLNMYRHTFADGTAIEPYTQNIGIDDDAKRYLEDADLRDKLGSEEDAKTYDNIYPTRTGKVTAIFADDICAFADNTMDFDLCEKDDNGTKYLVDGVSAKVTFVTGKLAGQQFELEAKEGYTHATKKFRIKKFTDNRGLTTPTADSEAFRINVGDTFKITEINLPDSYVAKAEEDLWYAAMEDFTHATQAKAQYTLTLDRLYFLENISRDVETSVFNVGDYVPIRDVRFGIEKTIRVQKITRNLLLEQDYQLTLADSSAMNVQTQTVLTVIDHENIISNNRLRDLNKARRGWRTTEDLRNMVYDTDGYFDTDNIRPNSIDTNMLTVGSKSQQFVLSGVLLEANFGGNANTFRAGAGVLSHLTIDENSITNWALNAQSFTLSDASGYYLFAKCSKTSKMASWYITQERLKVEPTEDPNNYYFQVGIIGQVHSDEKYRDFQTTYGFTRINGNTITTGRIVTSDGECYLDLDGNTFRIGDANSSIDWNVTSPNGLTLRNVSLVSGSGDVSPLGVFRGVWSETVHYYPNDEVSYTSGGETATYRYISPVPSAGNLPTNSVYWVVAAKGKQGEQGLQGKDGISPNTAYKSTVFLRSNQSPQKPTGGSYASPVPNGWSDSIPSGDAKLWASTRTFSSDGLSPQQAEWSEPRQMTDTADLDIVFSTEATPTSPTGHPNTNTQWSNEATDATIWMATSKKSNGVWSEWQFSRIKGENGQNGTSIRVQGAFAECFATRAQYDAAAKERGINYLIDSDEVLGKSCVVAFTNTRHIIGVGYKTTFTEAAKGDAYIRQSDGHLFISNDDNWSDIGQFKGDKGEDGSPGKNSYLHIKFAKSLTPNDWSANNGESPDAYIGVYSDNNPTDQLQWKFYSWTKWKGEDGYGYEYIFKLTDTETPPLTPTDNSQTDGFVPTAECWHDSPQDISQEYPYLWVCYRNKIDGVWSDFKGSANDPTHAALHARYGDKGDKGDAGKAGDFTEYRYAKSGSSSHSPSLATSSRNPLLWNTTMPSIGPLEYLWLTTAKIDGGSNTLKTQWTTPIRVTPIDGQKGEDGKSPALVFRGEYDAAKTYYGTGERVDCIKYNSHYYVACVDAGTFSNILPTESSKWNNFGAEFESLATGFLLTENANIANFIFRNERLESQTLNADGTPNTVLDGKEGIAWFCGSIINPFKRITKDNASQYITTFENGEFIDARLDLDKCGLKIMFDLSNTEMLNAIGGDDFMPPIIPAKLRYAGTEMEIYNGSSESIGFTGAFINTLWENYTPPGDITSIAFQPYTYYRYRCIPLPKSKYYPKWGNISFLDGNFYVVWVLMEKKTM